MATRRTKPLPVLLFALGCGATGLASWFAVSTGMFALSTTNTMPQAETAGVGVVVESDRPTDLTFERFEAIQTLIQPRQEENAYLGVPWETSLWEARKRAAREGKPILLWEMDGHPLGCT